MLARSRVRPHLVLARLPRICSGFQPCQEITHRFAADVHQVAHFEKVSISELSPLAPPKPLLVRRDFERDRGA